MRVSDYVASSLLSKHKVEKVFGVTGAGIMHLTDSFFTGNGSQVPQFVAVHHEESATMAADAYARKSKGIGVAVVSTGPGATNAITGVAGAFQDSVPMLVIAGQVKTTEALGFIGSSSSRQGGVQELDTLPLVRSITKAAERLDNPEEIQSVLARLIKIAKSGRPGPVWLEIPLDVQAKNIDLPESEPIETGRGQSNTKVSEVGQIISLLEKSRKPVLLVGQGVEIANAEESLSRFIRKIPMPVVSTYLGMNAASMLGEIYLGPVGIKGSRVANMVIQESDLLITLGASMHVSVTGYDYEAFSPKSIKVDINIDSTDDFKRNYKPNLSLQMESRDFLYLASNLGSEKKFDSKDWLSNSLSLAKVIPRNSESYPQAQDSISIYEVVNSVSDSLREHDTVVSDAGSAYYCTSQNLKLPSGALYITSGAMATMGFSLPAAIGAAFVGGRVYALTGDGSFQQSLQELSLLKTHSLPVCLIVLDNSGYLSIRNSQHNYFNDRYLGTDAESGLDFPDLSLLSKAYGIEYELVDKKGRLNEVLKDFERDPKIVHVICPKSELIIPNVSSTMGNDGQMVSDTLQNMSPQLNEQKLSEAKNLGFLSK